LQKVLIERQEVQSISSKDHSNYSFKYLRTISLREKLPDQKAKF